MDRVRPCNMVYNCSRVGEPVSLVGIMGPGGSSTVCEALALIPSIRLDGGSLSRRGGMIGEVLGLVSCPVWSLPAQVANVSSR